MPRLGEEAALASTESRVCLYAIQFKRAVCLFSPSLVFHHSFSSQPSANMAQDPVDVDMDLDSNGLIAFLLHERTVC